MRIAFVDVIDWDYTAESPYERPLGGSQSALCYLAASLAERGHRVTLVNHTQTPGTFRGVECLAFQQIDQHGWRAMALDACIALNSAAVAPWLRQMLDGDAKLVIWTQHAADQPAVASLAEATTRAAHDACVFVSQWQMAGYERRFGLAGIYPQRHILRNAIAPGFEGIVDAATFSLATRTENLSIAYTSTPFRGLDLLLQLFPRLQVSQPQLRLEVFSSMQVYDVDPAEDRQMFGPLYDACRQDPAIAWHGSLPQPRLARNLRKVAALAYPNTFAETSCISVMEAMACGCAIVTSRLGALPETTAGFACLIPANQTRAEYAAAFVEATHELLQRMIDADPQLQEQLREQIAFVNESYVWQRRAQEWEAWLTDLLTK